MSATPTAERTKCPLCVHVSTVYDGVGRCPAHGTFRATTPPPSAAVPDPAVRFVANPDGVARGEAPIWATDRPGAVPDPADVEKAARAIWETDPLFRLTPWEDAHPASRELYRRLAVAALTAARPSPDSEADDDPVATALDWIADNVEDDEGFVSADDLRVMAENAREGLDLFAPRAALGTGAEDAR